MSQIFKRSFPVKGERGGEKGEAGGIDFFTASPFQTGRSFLREFLHTSRLAQESLHAGVFFFLVAISFAPNFLHAQSLPEAEKYKIEALIKNVGELKNAKFIRNGSAHDPSTAVRFLRGKWNANQNDVKSARDFIDKVASTSGTSGRPYLIRFKDGKQIQSREFLIAELKKIES